MMTTLERIKSQFPRNTFADLGIDYSRPEQSKVSSVISGNAYHGRFVTSLEAPPVSHREEWNVYEDDEEDEEL